jgi:type IV pilus assembly protein PilB
MTISEEDNAIAKLVNRILIKAIEDRATNLYFEPQAKSLQIRIRKDGMLQTALQNLPSKMVPATIEYLKSAAKIGLDRSAPQLGTIEQNTNLGRVKIEITTLPTQFGDSVAAKIAYIQQIPLTLDRLIPDRQSLTSIKQLIHSNRGLILLVGGSDREINSTLYASLAELNRPDRSIYTLDCDFEYTIPGIDQIALRNDDPQTIEICLALSPDILSIGSIETLSTARFALDAVARGCLVFATIRADTAGAAIDRLIGLGVTSAQLYTAIIGIISQKSIGRSCARCRLPHELDTAELASLGNVALSLQEHHQYYQANSLSLPEIEQAKQIGKLCPKCQGLGHQGRIGLYEILIITERLKSAILSGDGELIDLAAIEMGLRTFVDLAVKLFQTGDTTLVEVLRCIPPKTLLQNQSIDTESEQSNLNEDREEDILTALYWKKQTDKVRAECDRLFQEVANYREESAQFEHRIEQSRSQVEQSTRAEIALQLLSVVDVVELARTSIKPQTDREAAIQKGYSMLEYKMIASIKEIGMRVTATTGQKFDPRLHEIVQEVGTHEHLPGIILEEFRRGYTLSDRVLRLAQVKVAVTPRFS